MARTDRFQYLKWDLLHSPFLPAQQSRDTAQGCEAKNIGLHLSLTPHWKLSSWKRQDFSIYHPVSSCLLLRPCLRWEWPRGEGFFLPSSHPENGGSTLRVVLLRILEPGPLGRVHKTVVWLWNSQAINIYLFSPTTVKEHVTQTESCHSELQNFEFCPGWDANRETNGSWCSLKATDFICSRVW